METIIHYSRGSVYILEVGSPSLASYKKIAYESSSSENPLGFEWMLLEKIEGVPLSDVWEQMDFESKVRLTLEISNLLQQQHDLEFSQIGNFYFATVTTQVNSRIGRRR